MFSSRLPLRLDWNELAHSLAQARSAGRALNDLTISNPTMVGFVYPAELFQALSKPQVSSYVPHAFGLRRAREAVAEEYLRRGLSIPWNRIVLTSSTSEAYSLLFKLLCAPCGDSVLVPVPSYPLFEHLTALDGVAARAYRLEYDCRWWLNVASVDEMWDTTTKAVLAVSPNNPTGSVFSAAERASLAARCASRTVPLIIDEVFADYLLDPSRPPVSEWGDRADVPLTFRLGGLSKSVALPQIKLGWIALDGPERLVAAALQRLEVIADAYLSVSTPAQIAAPDLLAAGASVRAQVLDRIRCNYAALKRMAAAHPSSEVLETDGGWSAVLRIPARESEERFVLDLLEQDGVVVHPGFFFDFPREAYLVVSLLPEPDLFGAGMRRVLERADV